jgi:hypothetical protein
LNNYVNKNLIKSKLKIVGKLEQAFVIVRNPLTSEIDYLGFDFIILKFKVWGDIEFWVIFVIEN